MQKQTENKTADKTAGKMTSKTAGKTTGKTAGKAVSRIPLVRILDRLDGFLDRNDFNSAERLLKNWAAEAEAGGDMAGALTIMNEQIGLYRKTGRETECMTAISAALDLVRKTGFEDSISGATSYINAATGYKAFGMADRALPLYGKARDIYEKMLPPKDSRLAGLYNNMALTLAELREYREAEALYLEAIEILGSPTGEESAAVAANTAVGGESLAAASLAAASPAAAGAACPETGPGESTARPAGHADARNLPDMAITYLNLADLVCAEYGPEEGEARIAEYLDTAERLLDSPAVPRDGYYAYVCEKCAPVFGYYGFFLTEQSLERRAEEIRRNL